jgi:S-layer homology domain
MKPGGVVLAISISGSALFIPAAGAQSYGTEEQLLTVGAAAFRPEIADTYMPYIDPFGYLRGEGGGPGYWAPLSLPEGALLEKICLYANDSDPSFDVIADLFAVKLVPGGEGPALQIVNGVSSSSDIGYGVYCSAPFSYTVRGRTDIDGDGTPDAVAYYAYALVLNGNPDRLGFGGVQITWKRQITPPPFPPTFADVPSSDPGFGYVEALVASGITAGCSTNPPLYCPDANLTRRQMAVFLAKALGLHWAD